MSHSSSGAGPVALSILGKGAKPDLHMVVLLLPAGEGLRGLGTYSGVMPRGFWDDVGDVGGAIGDVAGDVVDEVSDAGEWVVDVVEDAAEEAMDLAINTFEEVGPEALEMLDDAGDLYEQAQNLAYEAATNPNLAEDLMNQAAELAQQAASVTAQALEDSWDAAVDAATWLYDQADQYLKEIICKAMVYVMQGMDILAELAGPAAEALSELLAPVNQAVEDVVNEAVAAVGAEETLNDVKASVQDGMKEMVPQFAVIVGMMADIQYSRGQLSQLRGLMLSTSVCELSSGELESRMKAILDPLHARLVNLSTQVEASWEEQQPAPAPVDDVDDDILPAPVVTAAPLTLETVSVSSHPPIPDGLKATFRNSDGTASSSTCQVIKSGSLTCWAYSYKDNRSAFGVVAYDDAGNVIEQWEKSGARYLSRIELHPDTRTIDFVGQADRKATMNWDEMAAVQPPEVIEPDIQVAILDKPPVDSDPVPPAPPEEFEDAPTGDEDVPTPPVVQDKPGVESDLVPPAPPEEFGDEPAPGEDVRVQPVKVPEAPATTESKTPKMTKTPAIDVTTTSPVAKAKPASFTRKPRNNQEGEAPKTKWKSSFKTRRRGENRNLDIDWTPRTREGQNLRAGATLAQTFTTGKEGLLSGIALRINRRAWTNSDLTVDVRHVVNDGGPSSTVLFTATLQPGTFPLAYSETMTFIDLRSAGIVVKSGEVLAVTATNRGAGNFIWWGLEGFDGGQGWAYENREWNEINSDLVFQVEIDADAPEISTRGLWDQVNSVASSVIGATMDLPEFSTANYDNAAKGRRAKDVEEAKYSKTDGYRDICLGPSRNIFGVTVHPPTDGTGLSSAEISIEVYRSKEKLEEGTNPDFEKSITNTTGSGEMVFFDLRSPEPAGSYIRVRTDNIGKLGKVEVWSDKEWVYWSGGVQFSGAGFLTFLHPSLKPVAMALGFGTPLNEFEPSTTFGGGLTTGDPSFEIGLQLGFSRYPSGGDVLVLSGEAEIIWNLLPDNIPQLSLTTPEGDTFNLGSSPNITVTSPEGETRDLLGEGDSPGGTTKQFAVAIDVLLDPAVLWEAIKSPIVSNTDSCEWYKDVIVGFVLTIGREWEKPTDSGSPLELTVLYAHTWDWFFGL